MPQWPSPSRAGKQFVRINIFTLRLCGTKTEHNHANEGGGSNFFVSNDQTGSMIIEDSMLCDNRSEGFETQGLPGSS